MATPEQEAYFMKIALVAQHAAPAEDARLRDMSRSLASKGHHVTVYTRRTGTALPDKAEPEPGVRVEYIGPADKRAAGDESELLAQVPAFSGPLHERWRRERPDVVHALRWTSGLAALAAARDLRIPVVQSFDSLGVAERRRHVMPRSVGTERIRLEPAIGRSVNAVVAGSSDEESDLTRLGVPRRSIKVVPCGVDTDEFTPEGPVANRNGRPRLVTVAELEEHDALATLLHALSKVPGAELVVAGGPPRAELRGDIAYRRLAKVAESLGVSGRVLFAGQVGRSALPPLLRSADLLVSVSDCDPAGMVSVQAMACGTPVVASAVGGQVDAVVDGTTGILVPPGRPALLAQRIRQLLAHPMLLEAFSVAAADRARSRYSWDRIAHETLAVYDSAVEFAAARAA
jgi:glycosyltransferase involved in cell wall biosynthesis